jgi:ribosomal protein L29
MKTQEMRELNDDEKMTKLRDWRNELMEEYGRAAMGGSPPSPGRIRWLHRSIARMITIMKEAGEQE